MNESTLLPLAQLLARLRAEAAPIAAPPPEPPTLGALLRYNGPEFIAHAYWTLLGREPDPGGFAACLRSLEGGAPSKTEILRALRDSEEGHRLGIQVRGLTTPHALDELLGGDDATFLNRACRELLGREPVAEDWSAGLAGASRIDWLRTLRFSPEGCRADVAVDSLTPLAPPDDIGARFPLDDRLSASTAAPAAGERLEDQEAEDTQFTDAAHFQLRDLLIHQDETFVRNAYRAVLRREPDAKGLRGMLDRLREGALSKVEILGNLRFSAEGRRIGVAIPGLLWPWLLQTAARIPVLGLLPALASVLLRPDRIVRRLRHLEASRDFLDRQSRQVARQAAQDRDRLAESLCDVASQATAGFRQVDMELQQIKRLADVKVNRVDQVATEQAISVLQRDKADRAALAELGAAWWAALSSPPATIMQSPSPVKSSPDSSSSTGEDACLPGDAEYTETEARYFRTATQCLKRELDLRRRLARIAEGADSDEPGTVVVPWSRRGVDTSARSYDPFIPGPEPSALRMLVDVTDPDLAIPDAGGPRDTLLAVLCALGERHAAAFQFIFLTSSASHAAIRDLARAGDALLCVIEEPGHGLPLDSPYPPSESVWLAPTADLAARLRVDVAWSVAPHPETFRFAAKALHSGIPTLDLAELPPASLLLTAGLRQLARRQGLTENVAGNAAPFTAADLAREADDLAKRLRDCAARWPTPERAGITADGWIAEAALFSLPRITGRGALTLSFDEHVPEARLRIALGQRSFGGFRCAETPERTVRIVFQGPHRFVWLSAALARPPVWRSDADRIVRLQRLAVTDDQGQETVLWLDNPTW
jgi:hypothetical protein